MMEGTKQVAQRIVNAEDGFIDLAIEKGFSKEEAEKILSVYKKVKAIKIDPKWAEHAPEPMGYDNGRFSAH